VNARKYARGSRRPRVKRTRTVKVKRRGGGKSKGGICDMAVLAPASCLAVLPLVIALVLR
jgi:hypothetical protein